MRRFTRSAQRRNGFTMIELLVVIAIMATLAGLSAGAYFRVMSGQQIKRSETTLKKIHPGLAAQWSAAIDDAVTDFKSGKFGTGDTAKNDRINARIKEEFPISFSEPNVTVRYPQLVGASVPATNTLPPPLTNINPAVIENSVCLYLALTKTRRGATFNADDIGGGGVANITLSGKSFSYFVDAWGMPITLNRPTVSSNPEVALLTLFVRSAGPDRTYDTADDMNSFLLMKEGQRGN